MGLRADVYALDAGQCVGCGARLHRGGSVYEWHAHHCIRQTTMKARGLRPKWWRGPALCVLLCWACHGDQTSKMRPVPLEKLPQRIHRAVAILGPWAVDLLAREHPPMPTTGGSHDRGHVDDIVEVPSADRGGTFVVTEAQVDGVAIAVRRS